MPTIEELKAYKILESSGKWTISTEVTLSDGTRAFSAIPLGASVGKHEAKLVETDYGIQSINYLIKSQFIGKDAGDQTAVDSLLKEIDGTEDKSKLGANTILSVSLAIFKAAALFLKEPLYQHISEYFGFPQPTIRRFPTPLLNLLNGGISANNDLDYQSFMIAPGTFLPYSKGLQMGVKVYHKLKDLLSEKSFNIAVGQEGGFAPNGLDSYRACQYIVEAMKECSIRPGAEMFLAIDVAASTFYTAPNYQSKGTLKNISAKELAQDYISLSQSFPIIYLEDPFAEDAWGDWTNLKERLGETVNIVGDDLTVTNRKRVEKALENEAITALIIKPDQIGTLSETIDVIKLAQENNLTVVISHRSGETAEDSFIADLAVGVGATYIKAGAPARGERTAKYNRLLQVENELILKKTQEEIKKQIATEKPPEKIMFGKKGEKVL